MPWAGERRASCKVCGRQRHDGELFSVRGKCPDCGVRASNTNALQLNAGEGPYFDHWMRRSFMHYRKRLLDAERARAQTAGE